MRVVVIDKGDLIRTEYSGSVEENSDGDIIVYSRTHQVLRTLEYSDLDNYIVDIIN